MATKTKRIHRSGSELLAALWDERARIAARADAKLAALDGRIARMESRYANRIALDEHLAKDADALASELAEARRNTRLLRQALRQKA